MKPTEGFSLALTCAMVTAVVLMPASQPQGSDQAAQLQH